MQCQTRSQSTAGVNKKWVPTFKETQTNNINSRNCEQSWPHNGGKTAYPLSGKERRIGKKMSHFASTDTTSRRKAQQKRDEHVIEADASSSDDAHVYKLTMYNVAVGVNKMDERPHFVVSVNGHQLDTIADSGAEINMIDERNFNQMNPQPKLRHDNMNIFPYGSATSLLVKGIFKATVKYATQQSDEIL